MNAAIKGSLLVLLAGVLAFAGMSSGVLHMLWSQKLITSLLVYGLVTLRTGHTPWYWLARGADWIEAAQVATLAVIRPTMEHWRWQLHTEREKLKAEISR